MRQLLSAALLLAAISEAAAQDAKKFKKFEDDLDAKVKTFEQRRAKAQEAALKYFDQAVAVAKQSKTLDAATRTSLISRLAEDRKQFEKYGTWPENNDLIMGALAYSRQVSGSYRPVAEAYERLIDVCLKANDVAAAERYTRQKVQLERSIPGRDKLTAGSKWRGSQTDGKRNTTVHLNIKKVTGTVFEGEVHRNPGVAGHPIFEVQGVIHGNYLQCKTSRVIQGKAQELVFDGVLVGSKILMVVDGIKWDTKPAQFVWLELK